MSLWTGSQRGRKKIPRAKQAGVIASAQVSNQRYDDNVQIRRQWTVHCMRKPLLTVSARIMLIYKQLSRSVNYLSQSCQQSSIQPIRSWYQELVSWNGGINGMSTGSPAHSLLTRPLSAHPVRPRLHSNCTRLSPTGACSQAISVKEIYLFFPLPPIQHCLSRWICHCPFPIL